MSLRFEANATASEGLRLNPDCLVCVSYIGKEKTPVLVVDGFWQTPELLGDLVAAGMVGRPYDALQRQVAAVFARQLILLLQQHLEQEVAAVKLMPDELWLAIASGLAEEQLPRTQSDVGYRYQLLSFMTRNPADGVKFHRHRKTGFETIGQPQLARYRQVLQAQRMAGGTSVIAATQGGNDVFESTHCVPAWYNRAVIFPANLLHSNVCSNQSQPTMATENFILMATLELAVRPQSSDAE